MFQLRFCSRYEELRRGRNLEDEIEMIEYIADIMEMEDDASAEDDDVHEDGILAKDKWPNGHVFDPEREHR